MYKLSKYRVLSYITLIFFLTITLLPPPALAIHTNNWDNGGTGVPGTPETGGKPGNNEKGGPPNACSRADPVYVHSGEFFYQCSDLYIPGRGMDVRISHLYQSGAHHNSQFGYGWTINYHYRLQPLENGNVVILSGLARKDEYTAKGNNSYTPPPGFFETLTQNTNGTWTLLKTHGEKYQFDIDGKLRAIEDRNNNSITFAYDTDGLQPIVGIPTFAPDIIPARQVVGFDYKLIQITDTAGRKISLNYNADGLLDNIRDYAGREVKYQYDTKTNDLLSITLPKTAQYPNGLVKRFAYDNKHNLTAITDPKGQTFVRNTYNDNEQVIRQDLGGGTFTFLYAAKTTKVTDRRGFETNYTYNDAGNIIKMEQFTKGLRSDDPSSYITTYTYNNDMMITSVVYPKGNGVFYKYDETNASPRARGNVLEVRRKANAAAGDSGNDIVNRFTYEPSFNFIKTYTDGNNHIYALDYDSRGNLTRFRQPAVNNQTPAFALTYTQHGQLSEVTDPNNNAVSYSYFDATGYLKDMTADPGGISARTQYTYDNIGNILTLTDPNGDVTRYVHNELHWRIEEINPLGFRLKYTYDQNANITKIENQANPGATSWQVSAYTYDILNNLTGITDPLNRKTTFVYDKNENLNAVLDAEGNTTVRDYDERDFLLKITDANAPKGITRYDYDANGNLKLLTDANGNPSRYSYDGFDREQSMTYADNTMAAYSYDKNSNLTQYKSPRGDALNFVYDALNRRTAKNFSGQGALNTTYRYDPGSRLTEAANAAASNTFSYDALNRVVQNKQTVNSQAYALNYKYDPDSNRAELTYPSGKKINYQYDANDRLTNIKVNGIDLSNFTYDPLDRRITKNLITDHRPLTTYTFDLANQLLEINNKLFNNTLVSKHNYTYDRVFNRKTQTTQRTQQTRQTTYTYNAIYELTKAAGAKTYNFDYDNVYNREAADAVTYRSNNLNQYVEAGGINFTYDPNGNLTGDGAKNYTYDTQNRLSQLSAISPQLTAKYAYDAFDRRVSKDVDGEVTYFIYDGDEVIEERNASGTLAADYVLADRLDEVLVMNRAGQDYFYHYDSLGSVTEITNNSGTIVESYDYTPYGQPTIKNENLETRDTSDINNPYLFTGRRLDEESGLYYYRARMYDPNLGRFLQRDPLEYYDSSNLYGYVLNNPVNWTDAYGLKKGDQTYGYPKEFWNWYHRNWKRRGDRDATKEEAAEAFEEWERQGRPGPDNKKLPDMPIDLPTEPPTEPPMTPLPPIHPMLPNPPVIPTCDRDPENQTNQI